MLKLQKNNENIEMFLLPKDHCWEDSAVLFLDLHIE